MRALIACPRGLPPPAESCRGLPLAGNGKFPEGAPELPDFKQKSLKVGLFLYLLGGSMYFHFSHTLPRATVFQFALIFQYQGISTIRTACKKNSADYLFADYLCQTI